jgi:uncharacterized membrane protein
MEYLILKWVHIFSSTLLFGTGLGSAYYKYMTDRSGDLKAMAVTNRNVVLADWVFTTPTVILQPLTGFGLIYISGYSFTETWIWLSIILFSLAGLCWLPVVYLQIVMRNLSEESLKQNSELPEKYWRYARLWFWLGVPAFISLVAVFALMVFKP